MIEVPDFMLEMSDEEYFGDKQYVRSGHIKLLMKSAYDYKAEIDGISAVTKKNAYSFGTAAHLLILQGQSYLWEKFTTEPYELKEKNPETGAMEINRRKKDYQDWKKEQTLEILSDNQYQALQLMNGNVLKHEIGRGLIAGGVAERVVRANWNGVDCQIKIDYFNGRMIDLKTIDNIDNFEYQARKFGYVNQAKFYIDVFQEASDEPFPPPFYWLVVEKQAPYRVGVWDIDEMMLKNAEAENIAAVNRLKEAREFDHWPHAYQAKKTLSFYRGY